jgi:hypothetical protein
MTDTALTIAAAEQVRARAQSAYRHMLGAEPPLPMSGESLTAYRVRLLEPVKSASTTWRGINRATLLASAPSGALEVAERQVYADAVKTVQTTQHGLRSVTEPDQAGRPITRFFGDPGEWMDAFKAPAARARFRRPSRGAE